MMMSYASVLPIHALVLNRSGAAVTSLELDRLLCAFQGLVGCLTVHAPRACHVARDELRPSLLQDGKDGWTVIR